MAVFLPPDAKVRCPACGDRATSDEGERFLAIHRQFPEVCDRDKRIRECEERIAYWQRELDHARPEGANQPPPYPQFCRCPDKCAWPHLLSPNMSCID